MSTRVLPREPDYLIPVTLDRFKEGYSNFSLGTRLAKKIYRLELEEKFRVEADVVISVEKTYKNIEETIDDILYWDENANLIYVEAIAFFKDTGEFIRFRHNIQTKLHLKRFRCQICGSKEWEPRNVDAKTVQDEKGRSWKCFSIIFACKQCLQKGRLTERSIQIQGIKYALIKVGRGLKDFLDRIKRIRIDGDLSQHAGSAMIEVGEQKLRLRRCPLL